MKKAIRAIIISIAILGCTGSTKLTVSYTQENIQPKKYNKLAIVALTNSDPNRLVLEEALANKFKADGINAIITFNIFPLAGRPDVLADMNLDPEDIKNHIRKTVKENNIDALIIISLLNTRQVERYVNRSVSTVGYYDPIMYPTYNYRYYDYYWYVHNTTHNTGYYTTETTYFVETNLYDVETEKLLWTGQTKTENMSSIEAEAPKFAKIIVWDILGKKVLIRE
ncbi:hypothetical protein ES705_25126 [subsurface metagenome]